MKIIKNIIAPLFLCLLCSVNYFGAQARSPIFDYSNTGVHDCYRITMHGIFDEYEQPDHSNACYCRSKDCEAITENDIRLCETADCRALVKLRQLNLSKVELDNTEFTAIQKINIEIHPDIIKAARGEISDDAKAIITRRVGDCISDNCRAMLLGDYKTCRRGGCCTIV